MLGRAGGIARQTNSSRHSTRKGRCTMMKHMDQERGCVARPQVLRRACAKSSAGRSECPATFYPFATSAHAVVHFQLHRSQSHLPACAGPLPIRAGCSAHGAFRHNLCRSWDQPFACGPGYSRAPSAARHKSCGDSARPSDDLRACHPPANSDLQLMFARRSVATDQRRALPRLRLAREAWSPPRRQSILKARHETESVFREAS